MVVIQKTSNKAYILLESLVALIILSTFFIFFLDFEVTALKIKKQAEEKAQLSRIMHEEVKEYLYHGGASQRLVTNGQQTIVITIKDHLTQLVVTAKSPTEKIEVSYEK